MTRFVARALGAVLSASFLPSMLLPVEAAPVVRTRPAVDGLATQRLVSELRGKVKYVFVLYQENRSFDSLFGTFPGANGLFSQPAAQTAGYNQPIENTDGSMGTQTPFRIDPTVYSADVDDADHAHSALVAKMDVQSGVPQMDGYSLTEEKVYSPSGNPSEQAKQFGELAMAHEDCDTVPLLWNYANRFTLFDGIFQTMTAPSTPGNIAIFAGQAGLTQFVEHPNEANSGNGNSGPGVPVLNDANPFWGSSADPTKIGRMPYNPADGGTPQDNLTFASLALTLQGKGIASVVQGDRDPANDLGDVNADVKSIAKQGQANPIDWGWFQEGFDKEPTDGPSGPSGGTHNTYITHHNGPQYIGYISNNLTEQSHVHGMADFFNAVSHRTLSSTGGVYYLKGGYQNIFGLKPTDPDPAVQASFLGDDDHPAYSDAQISEANVARAINQIARSPYWKNSAIVITWDDSEGYYDHARPPLRDSLPGVGYVSEGPRVPLIVISPFAKTGNVSHELGDQVSVVKMIDKVFGLQPLASLPDELRARHQGFKQYGQFDMGPLDSDTNNLTGLLSAFDPDRLSGAKPPLGPGYVIVPERYVSTLPAKNGLSCKAIGVMPTDEQLGIQDTPPADFNPRPGTDPPPHARRVKVSTARLDD